MKIITSNPPRGRDAYWKWREKYVWESHQGRSVPHYFDLDLLRREGTVLGTAMVDLLPAACQMFILGQDEIALEYFRKVKIIIEEAIRIDDLNGFVREKQEEYGRYCRARVLFLADWVLTKERNETILREVLPLHKKTMDRAVLFHDHAEKGWDPGELLANYLELGEFDQAVQEYRRLILEPIQLPPPKRPQWAENTAHCMYVVANYLGGEKDLEAAAQGGMEHFYQKMTDWGSKFEQQFGWREKLGFAYIRGKYFTGETDPIQLIKNLRYGR